MNAEMPGYEGGSSSIHATTPVEDRRGLKVDKMLLDAMDMYDQLSIPYDEESVVTLTTETTREKVKLLQGMHNEIKRERRSHRSPTQAVAGYAVGTITRGRRV